MPITALPAAPNRATDTPAAFATKADALLSALAQFVTDANALQLDCNNQQATATAQAAGAVAQALQAASSAAQAAQALAAAQAVSGASKWAAGPYAAGAVVWSPTNGQNYRARAAIANSTTDPADPAAAAYWFPLLLQQSLPVVQITAAGNTQATANVHYLLMVGGVNLIMPPNPQPGDLIGITNASGLVTSTADPNGKSFAGDPSIMKIDVVTASAIFKNTTAIGWIKQ